MIGIVKWTTTSHRRQSWLLSTMSNLPRCAVNLRGSEEKHLDLHREITSLACLIQVKAALQWTQP